MKRSLAFALVVCCLVVFACWAGAQDKVYKLGIGEDPTTINRWAGLGPNESSVYNSYVTAGWYASLYTYADYTMAFAPNLAADMPSEWIQEGDLYTSIVPLRKGIMWSNGKELTADDVVFTYSTIIEFNLTGNWETYHPPVFEKVEKVDDYHVKFYMNAIPGLSDWNYGVLQCTLLSEAEWGSVVEEARNQPDPAQYLYAAEVVDPVTINGLDFEKWEKGAFVLNQKAAYTSPGGTMVFADNGIEIYGEDWSWSGYGEPGQEVKYDIQYGPFLDKVLYRLYANQDAMLMALKKGDIDFWMNSQGLSKGFKNELSKDPNVEIVTNPSNGFRYMAFNRERYPFNIDEFQQAIATLIDREMVCNDVLQGACIPMYTCVPPGNAYWHNPEVPIYGLGMSRVEKVATAIELLEKAGFSWKVKPTVNLEDGTYTEGQGIIMPNGEPMKPWVIMTPPAGYDPLRATFGLYIQVWLQELGIPATSKPTQFNTIVQNRNSGNYDAFILGWALGGVFPNHMDTFFRSGSGFNFQKSSDAELDAILDKFVAATDMEVARDWAFKAQERIAETLPYIILFSTPIYDAYRNDRIEFPFTETIDGIQGSYYGMPTSVHLVE